MKWKFLLIVVASGFLTLSACSKKASENDSATPADSHAKTNGNAQENANTQPSTNTKEAEAKKDLDEPLSSYLDVTGDNQWPSKWFFANGTGFTDEDIMNTLEPSYKQEQNAFKKHQMMEEDLASLKQGFVKFKGVKYVKFSDVTADGEMADPPNIFNGYDFSSQSFKLSSSLCLNTGSPGNIRWVKSANPNICHLKVTDKSLAEKIESARQNLSGAGSLGFTGTIYAKIVNYDSFINLQATHAHYNVGISKSFPYSKGSTPLASFDL
ncbi:hypothetical protein LRK24_04650 [Rhodanobacter denitrificans]|uniref:hypothetical protein n=1 Tax=Rhodanobacter TaxID=75309 RepID=UPI000AAAA733|nr:MULTISPECIES: hypothetical protein [Rhodanobacter]UJM91208.1 hypothetical protein LRK24_04650 [Rhodanobacter denitrificans]